jgi:hypothetical protein
MHEQLDNGLCERCESRRLVELYIEQDFEAAEVRRRSWRCRTKGSSDSSEAQRLRQQRFRLLRAVQPIEPPSPDADPYELAHEALVALSGVHAGVLHKPQPRREGRPGV